MDDFALGYMAGQDGGGFGGGNNGGFWGGDGWWAIIIFAMIFGWGNGGWGGGFGGGGGINTPAGSYANGEKYCIVVVQPIPDEATRNAPVFVTIGDGEASYPLVTQCCRQITQNQLQTRWKYTTILRTSATSGSFVVVGRLPPPLWSDLPAIDGTDPTTDTGGGATT